MGPTRAAPAGASCMPTFLPGLGQQLFYGQAQPTFIPPQPGFGHRYQLVPGQHGPRPGGSHVGFHGQQIQQQPVLMQQQMVPYGPMSHNAPASNIADVSMASYPYDAGNVMQLSDAGGSSALANAFPTEQRTMSEQRFFSGRGPQECLSAAG
ncbi:hypothetical protein Hdeb2414_s0070g00772981 [Helianthus debilis subsp. tardiflorus]